MNLGQKITTRALATAAAAILFLAPVAVSQDSQTIETEYLERQNVDERLQTHGVGVLGDTVDLNTGALSFEHVDISIPGNSSLEVALRRTRSQGFPFAHVDAATYTDSGALTNDFSDWTFETARISLIVPVEYYEDVADDLCNNPGFVATGRIAQTGGGEEPGDPHTIESVTIFSAGEMSNGYDLNIPGAGSQKLLADPQGISWPSGTVRVTKNFWRLECTTATTGEDGFLAIAPNGDEFRFDILAYRPEPAIPFSRTSTPYGGATGDSTTLHSAIGRTRLTLLVSEVTDVSGNWVRYEYNNDKRVSRIHANDGREIIIGRRPDGLIDTATANGRVWQYQYITNSGNLHLGNVVLPDGRSWSLNMVGMTATGRSDYGCISPDRSVSLTHPDGISGTFVVRETRHQTSLTRKALHCQTEEDANLSWFKMMSVMSKTLSGPGYPAATWSYNYSGGVDDGSAIPLGMKWGEVTDPTGVRMRSFYQPGAGGGAPFYSNPLEGLQLKTEMYGPSGLIQTVDYEYAVEDPIGSTWLENESPEKFVSPRPLVRTITTREGETYTTEQTYQSNHAAPDYSYANPIQTEQFSTLQAGSRITETEYYHDTSNWIIGLPDMTERNGKVFDEFTYDTLGRVTLQKRFGITYRTFGYHPDGNIAWVEDALGRRVSLGNYKRGTPQLITRPDNLTMTRVVDDNGWLLSQTDALLRTTAYDYNDAGRLTLIDRPGTFASTVVDWATIASGTRQTITTGAQRIIVNYDGMLRPYVTETRDLTNVADTVCDHAIFDALNRETYTVTHPVSGATSQCLTAAQIATEFANATPYAITTTEYLTDNRTRVTDAEGHATTTTASGYGAPDDGNPILIAQPEGVSTSMSYDIYGNLLSATQGGGGVSQTQTWTYDARLRLCRHTTPETGSTLYEYNNANQLIGMANGQGTGTNCTTLPAADRITNQYDSLGRLDLVDYAGSTPDVDLAYFDTGTLQSVTRGSSVWTYAYNELDAPTSETLTIDGRTYQLNYGYDTNGYMASSTLPDGRNVAYSPDGFGRPTRASIGGVDYASGVTYDIYGALTELTYGNGATLREGRNGRNQSIWRDVVTGNRTAISYTYDHDLNGRITSILDGKTAGFNRAFAYDGIGRLTTANGQWGNGNFAYDALGNITSKTLGSRTVEIEYNANNQVNRFRDTAQANAWQGYVHDARGNVIDNGLFAHGGVNFTYDLSNQPTSLVGQDDTGSFTYDGNYKRVKQTINGETIYTMYNLAGEVAYRDNVTTGEVTSYARLGGRTVARFKGAEVAYLHADHLGSPVAATDETGAILWAEHFTPYGESIPGPAANPDDEGFTGHIQDTDTGLTYMQARYYDPVIGRFLSNDPVGFAEGGVAYFNRYAYTANDPVNAIDPDGLAPWPSRARAQQIRGARIASDREHSVRSENTRNINSAQTKAVVGSVTIPLAVTGGSGALPACAAACSVGVVGGSTLNASNQIATSGTVDPLEVSLFGIAGGLTGGTTSLAVKTGLGVKASSLTSGSLAGGTSAAVTSGVANSIKNIANGDPMRQGNAGVVLSSGFGGAFGGGAGAKLGSNVGGEVIGGGAGAVAGAAVSNSAEREVDER